MKKLQVSVSDQFCMIELKLILYAFDDPLAHLLAFMINIHIHKLKQPR